MRLVNTHYKVEMIQLHSSLITLVQGSYTCTINLETFVVRIFCSRWQLLIYPVQSEEVAHVLSNITHMV